VVASCGATPPAGAVLAPALPTYAGTCPALAAAPAMTTLSSSGADRSFVVVRPATIAAGEKLPVVFFWHWLGGDPQDVLDIVDIGAAAELRRFIGVIPKPKGDVLFRWPFESSQSDARVEEEAKFFDDALACVGAALPVNKECVATAGVSAGALWSAQLAGARANRLSSIVSLSGGVDGIIRPWTPVAHKLPALVLWGGPTDVYPSNFPVMKFETASKKLEEGLAAGGHAMVECVHNCGHDVPPLDPPAAGAHQWDLVWKFVLDHPYWLGAGQSPYAGKPLPAGFPAWCGQGKGGATPRAAGAACP
jgi:predicted esterase